MSGGGNDAPSEWLGPRRPAGGAVVMCASRQRSLRLGVGGHSPCPARPALSHGTHTGRAGAIPVGPRSVTARLFPAAAWPWAGADGDLQVDTGVAGTKASAWQPRLEVTGGVIILQKVLTILVSLKRCVENGRKVAFMQMFSSDTCTSHGCCGRSAAGAGVPQALGTLHPGVRGSLHPAQGLPRSVHSCADGRARDSCGAQLCKCHVAWVTSGK